MTTSPGLPLQFAVPNQFYSKCGTQELSNAKNAKHTWNNEGKDRQSLFKFSCQTSFARSKCKHTCVIDACWLKSTCLTASTLHIIILFVFIAFLQVVRLIRLLQANYTLAGANETFLFSCLPSSLSALREFLTIRLMDAILIKYLPKAFQDVCVRPTVC